MERQGVGGVIVLEEPVVAAHRTKIAELATTRGLPTVFPREQVDAGGLFCYGTSLRSATQRMAQYAKKVLEGVSPSDLPVTNLFQHGLVVNLRTAQKLGLVVPSAIAHRAVELIE